MEFLISLGKSILLLPIGALLETPFIQLGNRILVKKKLSFGAAFMMALISGGAMLVAHAALYPVLATLGEMGQSALSLAVALALASGLYGYFLTDEQGRSIGYLKGLGVVLLSSALFGAVLLLVALVIVLAGGQLKAHARMIGNPYPDLLLVDGAQRVLDNGDPSPLKPVLDGDAALRARMDKHGRGRDKEMRKSDVPCDLRGYRASWEIRDDVLYLVKLELGCDELRDVPLSLLFPGQRSPVRASWFSGQLALRTKWGRSLYHVNAGAVTGASTIERGAPDAPYLPRAFYFQFRPLNSPSCEVQLERDTLVHSLYQIGAADKTLKTKRIVPSEQQWRDFRRTLDERYVWRWRGPYHADGAGLAAWGLSLEYMDSPELNIGGYGAFPDGFVRYRLALQALLGGLPCPEVITR